MRGVSTLAEAWFQGIVIAPGRSSKSRRFITQLARRIFIGDATTGRQALALRSRQAAGSEAQFGSCRIPPGSASSGDAITRRGLGLLHLEAVKPRSDIHTLASCPPFP